MMIERLLFHVIEDGIAFLKANPDLISEFFATEGLLDISEAEKIRDYFLKEPPAVIHGYARSDQKFPIYAITLAAENETQAFIGDEGGFVDDPEDENYGADQAAAIFGYTYNIYVYAQHPDATLYMYHLLRQMLFEALPVLKGTGDVFDVRFSGADLAPDPAWVPAGLFLRRVTITCSREYHQTILSSKLGRAWKVQSIHLDAKGAVGEDVGGVLTHVTTPDSEEG